MNDLRFAIRQLLKSPAFTALAAGTLALGVAGNVVIFSIFSAFYLRPFPFAEPERLVDLDETAPRWNLEYTGLSYQEFNGWRGNNRSFDGMAAWKNTSYNVSFEGQVERVNGARVTHDLASVLRLRMALGRAFTAEEDRPGAAKVVLLGYRFWKRQFAGREDVLGRTLRLDHEPFTIIGVLPPDESVLVQSDLWVPLAYDSRAEQGWFLQGVGRLKPGVSLALARDDLRRVHQGLVEGHGANENTSPRLTPLSGRFFGTALTLIRMLLGAVAVVLLIACGNVAALMLARGLARSRELVLRLSLGATFTRVARLIGLESLLLATLGGLGGLALGHWGLQTVLRAIPEDQPRWLSFEVDWRVWLFALLMVLVSALLGALPVVRSAVRTDLRGALQSSAQQSTPAGGSRRSLHTLVVAEVALTLVLMVQAGLLVQSFRFLQRSDPGYRPDHLLVYQLALPDSQYGSSEARLDFFRGHLERLHHLAGVVSASAVSAPPLGGHWGNFFDVENQPRRGPNEPDPVVLQRIAFPGYHETMQIPLAAGRSFTDQDGVNEGSRAVIVNETFARRFWPKQNPIGKRIRHRYLGAPWMTVVGVAKDVKHYGADQPMIPGVYLPFIQDPQSQMSVVVRSSVPPASLIPTIRALVRERDPDLALFGAVTQEERIAQSMWVRRLTASLFGIFSGVSLAMALGGIYGVFSYLVNRRTGEIGLRLALGARRRDVLQMVVRQGLTLVVIGASLGLLAALLITPLMRHLLSGVSPFDPLTFTGITAVLAAVGLLACYLPARRAMQVDPIVALRYE